MSGSVRPPMVAPSGSMLRSIRHYGDVFLTPLDAARYARLRLHLWREGDGREAASIRLRALGGESVVCRRSQDVWTFKHTFLDQLHLPPVPLPESPVILDLGSNVGYTVAHMAHLYQDARVLGVEMDAANVELAQRNTAAFGERVAVVHAAVWASDCQVHYSGEKDDEFFIDGTADVGDGHVVRACRVGTLLDEYGIGDVDYAKIDIEGAEGPILERDPGWLRRVRSLKIEVHPPVSTTFCMEKLEEQGFRCWLDPRHPNGICAVRDAIPTG